MTYETITKRRIELTLSAEEHAFLAEVRAMYSDAPEWSNFSAWWTKEYLARQLPVGAPLYRVCQDLEARLGIEQGKVAPPDTRDFLADRIEEQYGSRYQFCKDTGLDPGQLSRYFARKRDLDERTLERVLKALHAKIAILSEDDFNEQLSSQRAAAELHAV